MAIHSTELKIEKLVDGIPCSPSSTLFVWGGFLRTAEATVIVTRNST